MLKHKLFLSSLILFLTSVTGGYAQEREFMLSEKLRLDNLGPGEKDIRLWLPYPVDDEWQEVRDFKLSAPVKGEIVREKKYANPVVYLHFPFYRKSNLEVELNLKILRREYNFFRQASLNKKNLKRFLKPDRLVFVDSEMQELAEKITKDKDDRVEKARAIYDYIIDEFTYTKDDPRVCKLGNSRLSLEFKKGQCSEYHSAFISLARSLGIPAKFELGFTIPADKREGEIGGYHCWAKFYVQDKGWFPVDISEADKNPQMKDYFFGRINENRAHFTAGRDITLPKAQDKEAMPLNYFIYPYAEVDGRRFDNIETKISFKELKETD